MTVQQTREWSPAPCTKDAMIICFWKATYRGIPETGNFKQRTTKLYNEVLLQHIQLGADATNKISAGLMVDTE